MQDRLNNLKNRLRLQWGELAEMLGVSRSMLDQVRKGDRFFGQKTIRRLEEIESGNNQKNEKCEYVHTPAPVLREMCEPYGSDRIKEIEGKITRLEGQVDALCKMMAEVLRK